MRKIIIILCLLFFNSLEIKSQSNVALEIAEKDGSVMNVIDSLTYSRDNGMEFRVIFKYNANAAIERISSEWLIDGVWDLDYSDTYEYDGLNNLTSITTIIEPYEELINWRKRNYTYFNDGKVESEIFERWDNDVWSIEQRHLNMYDYKGNIIERLTEVWFRDENIYLPASRTSYYYDDNERVIYEVFEQMNYLREWENSRSKSYIYGPNGNITQIDDKIWYDEWSNDQKYTYLFEGDMLTEELTESWSGSEWSPFLRAISFYDDAGIRIGRTKEVYYNTYWDFRGMESFVTDNNGNLIQFLTEDTNDSNAVLTNNFIDIFGPNGSQYFFIGCNFNIHYSKITNIQSTETKKNFFELYQNYPNPFNPTTEISYSIKSPVNVSLKVIDVLGRVVATLVNERKNSGTYLIQFDGSSLPSGVYFYRIKAGNFVETKKMLLMK